MRPDERLAALALGCLTRGLGWIERHIDLFVPDDPFDPEKLKELAELSILHGCLRAWHDACRSLELAPISKVLLEFLGDPRIAEWVRKLPAYYSPYMLAYLPLRATGVRIGGFEAALRVLTLRHYPEGLETTPYRELEFQHLCWKAGLTRRQPSCGAVYRRTTLARCPNPIYFSNPEVYSVTHTIFYLNDIAGPCRSMFCGCAWKTGRARKCDQKTIDRSTSVCGTVRRRCVSLCCRPPARVVVPRSAAGERQPAARRRPARTQRP